MQLTSILDYTNSNIGSEYFFETLSIQISIQVTIGLILISIYQSIYKNCIDNIGKKILGTISSRYGTKNIH